MSEDCRIISFENKVLTIEIINPKSLLGLLEEYGTKRGGFQDDVWWTREDFAKDAPEPGIYKINVETQFTSMNHDKQKENIPEGWDFPHPAVISQAILKYYKETEEGLLKKRFTATSLTGKKGEDVCITFGPYYRLQIRYRWHWMMGIKPSFLGVSLIRKVA